MVQEWPINDSSQFISNDASIVHPSNSSVQVMLFSFTLGLLFLTCVRKLVAQHSGTFSYGTCRVRVTLKALLRFTTQPVTVHEFIDCLANLEAGAHFSKQFFACDLSSD
jgi:hypothetical protein